MLQTSPAMLLAVQAMLVVSQRMILTSQAMLLACQVEVCGVKAFMSKSGSESEKFLLHDSQSDFNWNELLLHSPNSLGLGIGVEFAIRRRSLCMRKHNFIRFDYNFDSHSTPKTFAGKPASHSDFGGVRVGSRRTSLIPNVGRC